MGGCGDARDKCNSWSQDRSRPEDVIQQPDSAQGHHRMDPTERDPSPVGVVRLALRELARVLLHWNDYS